MLKNNVSKKSLSLYYISIILTWIEALINPVIVSLIVESFEVRNVNYLFRALIFGIVSNLILLLGLSGKRYYYSKIIAEFRYSFKSKIFYKFLKSEEFNKDEVLSSIEKDSVQIENNYIEPTVILISSIGFTSVSIIYALYKNLLLGLLFIVSYSIPALLSKYGSKKLNTGSEKLAKTDKDFVECLEDFRMGCKVIKSYGKFDFFIKIYLKLLRKDVDQYKEYEKRRTKNNIVINFVDIVCSTIPLILGGFLAFRGSIDSSKFIAIYLVSYNIGYQFQEMAYYINTRSSSKFLLDKYKRINKDDSYKVTEEVRVDNVFPIKLNNISFSYGKKQIFKDFNLTINNGDKIAIIGDSGSGKSTLLNLLFGYEKPKSGEILFNGKRLNMREVRSFTSYISQESYVFNMKLKENISMSENFNQNKLYIINQLKLNKLQESDLNNHNISGGEKQRIEISRSIYHDKKLILADEIKSNLDKSNREIIDDILLNSDKTIVEVIHQYDEESLKRYTKVVKI
ncbi:MAG: ABC transporter ATP-binding protein [Finegoldia sp.]|nr:ABC transporter ATP-binding protein [Finegoldia sp.]